MSNRLEEKWKNFLKYFGADDDDPEATENTRRVYFAGMFDMFYMVTDLAVDAKSPEEFSDAMNKLNDEIGEMVEAEIRSLPDEEEEDTNVRTH